MQLSKEHEQILADIGGRLPSGKPKLRIVSPDEAKRPHGKLKGTPKYLDPETGKPMECLMLEMWVAPELCGTPETWPSELLGPYPATCSLDCCNGGFWGLRSPLSANGEYVPVTDQLMEAVRGNQYMSLQWSLLSETERLEKCNANLSERNQKSDEEAFKEYDSNLESYLINKEKEDNADNRVFSFPKGIKPDFKNVNMAIGGPKIKI